MNPIFAATRYFRLLPALALAGLLTELLAGCYGSVPMQSTQAPARASSGYADESQPSSYRVGAGDNIYVVARRFNISVRALIDANGLQPPFQLNPGQILKLPSSGGYVVQKGDTLSKVAKKTGSQFSTLARINGLTAPYVIHVGQKLQLADIESQPGQDVTVIESPGAAGAGPESAGQRPSVAQVPLSNSQNQAVQAPVTLAAPPAAAQSGDSYKPLAEREAASNPVVVATSPNAQQPAASSGQFLRPSGPPTAAAAGGARPAVSDSGFVWPVSGEVIAGFGTYGKEQHNDGINIKVPVNTPVMAAADGTVAYAGNELRGFGSLLLIKHANGWMSAYAHNSALLVKRGETVKRGQIVARSGDSGGVSPPQLHFELRRGVRPIDPMTELPEAPKS